MPTEKQSSSSEEVLERLRVVLEDASRRVQENPSFAEKIRANWEKGSRLGN